MNQVHNKTIYYFDIFGRGVLKEHVHYVRVTASWADVKTSLSSIPNASKTNFSLTY